MKASNEDLCICGRTLIVGDGTVLSPGYAVISPATGLIKAVSPGAPAAFSESSIITADVVCPGFVDIHTHGIGGSEDVVQGGAVVLL